MPTQTPKTKPGPTRRARVVAKITKSTHPAASTPVRFFTVKKPNGDESESVIVSFEDQSRRECYQVNYCYEESEGNDVIYEREVKPLISGVFDGFDATVIASGARGSGKSFLVQGLDEELGLATLAMNELLVMAEKNGNLIAISCYEIVQERVYDVLNANRVEVLVLGNAQGKTKLKGLSQVPVTSVSEFQKLYGVILDSRKEFPKAPNEFPRRCHKGLIVYVLSQVDNLKDGTVGKMNFVDLAGYEDTRRKNIDAASLIESTKINKSIYALQNVICSLNSNDSHVPYRESKLTHMLQDSLRGTGRVLMITCLNPFFCQDSIYMMNLAARSCQGTYRTAPESTKKCYSSASQRILTSSNNRTPSSVVSTVKKQSTNKVQFSQKKNNCPTSVLKARKLMFAEAKNMKAEKVAKNMKAEKILLVKDISDVVPATDSSQSREENSFSSASKAIVPSQTDDLSISAADESNNVTIAEASPLMVCDPQELMVPDKDNLLHDEFNNEVTSGTKVVYTAEKGHTFEKENCKSLINEVGSPPISAKLGELSNTLKLLHSSTSAYLSATAKDDTNYVEPRTPASTSAYLSATAKDDTNYVEPRTPELGVEAYDVLQLKELQSPWQKFSARSTGVQKTYVDDYLNILNTAGKEDLKKLQGIGEKRATYILERREESPVPFKSLDDLKDIGLSAKQIKRMIKKEIGQIFD